MSAAGRSFSLMNDGAAGSPQAGLCQVTTGTSVYLLELDRKQVTRVPDAAPVLRRAYHLRRSPRCGATTRPSGCSD